jgi:hypothetical protein
VTVVVLAIIFGITNTFRPFPDDVFRYGQDSILLSWSLNKFTMQVLSIFIMKAILSSEKCCVTKHKLPCKWYSLRPKLLFVLAFPQFFARYLDIHVSRSIVKAMYLQKLKRIINWSGGNN